MKWPYWNVRCERTTSAWFSPLRSRSARMLSVCECTKLFFPWCIHAPAWFIRHCAVIHLFRLGSRHTLTSEMRDIGGSKFWNLNHKQSCFTNNMCAFIWKCTMSRKFKCTWKCTISRKLRLMVHFHVHLIKFPTYCTFSYECTHMLT